MFKAGQLVRSRKYRDLYVVEGKVLNDSALLWCKPLTKKRFSLLTFDPERLELIGNNYKAK